MEISRKMKLTLEEVHLLGHALNYYHDANEENLYQITSQSIKEIVEQRLKDLAALGERLRTEAHELYVQSECKHENTNFVSRCPEWCCDCHKQLTEG